ncbi:MAG: SDR family oxidoreductase [Chloroflexi bacterium]|nr:SDR family oxidoreductase [Chloroflexota bacterium]
MVSHYSLPSERLEGRVVLITGAARGFGRAVAERVAVEGGIPVLVDRDRAELEACASALTSRWNRSVRYFALDITQPDHVRHTVAVVAEELGAVHGVVTSAGILRMADILHCTLEEWDEVLRVNLTGTFLTCQAVLPLMVRQNFGRVVTVSSTAGKQGGILSGIAYNSAKGGVLALTKSLARQFGPMGITCNCVCPGPADTPMGRQFTTEQRAHLRRLIPMGRLGTAEDVAGAICFLLSADAAYITGEMLDVNGGLVID